MIHANNRIAWNDGSTESIGTGTKPKSGPDDVRNGLADTFLKKVCRIFQLFSKNTLQMTEL